MGDKTLGEFISLAEGFVICSIYSKISNIIELVLIL